MEYGIIFLPLIGFLCTFIFNNCLSPGLQNRFQSFILFSVCGCMLLAWGATSVVFYQLLENPLHYTLPLGTWISVGTLTVDWALRFDSLSIVMMIVVHSVSFCVHWYSLGYMKDDPNVVRFMGYLSLFTFAMLMLVTSTNFVQLFFGWEAVGLASYLLIGFWNERPSANAAAVKAFVVNRVGDVGLCLGIAAIFATFGSLQFDTVFVSIPTHVHENASFLSVPVLSVICGLLFIGAMGKSAQLGLHVWLPDAMEGPTPVSALIHAATMVTAGVFMVARLWPLFEQAPGVLEIIMILGGITAFFAATVALVQTDIKRIIAYSTCSQLGYMFMASGVAAYHVSIFHLFTHAFFKALLFLGAGSVIHCMSNEQNIEQMGGLRRLIPLTYGFLWIGTLALIGFPGFSGYYSKDLILEVLWAKGTLASTLCFYLGVGVAFLTAFYSGRLLFVTFHGTSRANEKVLAHVHESPLSMVIPLSLLSIGAIASGVVFHHPFLHPNFWGKSIGMNPFGTHVFIPPAVQWAPVMAAITGLGGSFIFYTKISYVVRAIQERFSKIYTFLTNQWFINEFYHCCLVIPLKKIADICKRSDESIIDQGFPLQFAKIAVAVSTFLSTLQTGQIYHYIMFLLIGILSIFTTSLYFY